MNHTNKGKAKIFSATICTTMMLLLTFCNNSIGFNMASFHIPLTTADTTPVQKTIPSTNIVDPTITSLPKPPLANNRRDTVPSVKKDTTIVNTVDSFNFKIGLFLIYY